MLKIGWSTKDISIEGPIPITGLFYQRISRGILDPNTLTALVIDDGENVATMVSLDLVGLGDGIVNEMREAIEKKCSEIDAKKIIFNVTHTHTSPRFFREGYATYDHAPSDGVEMIDPMVYREFLVNQTADAVIEAYKSRKEGSFAYGSDYAVVGHHRRAVYRDDLRLRPEAKNVPPSLYTDKYARMYGRTNDPMFLEYEGNVDSSAYFLFTFDKDEKLTGAIVNVPCPSQNSMDEYYLSADYWADFRKLVKEQYGDIYILPQCAAAGDMSPHARHAYAAENRRHRLKYGDEKIDDIIGMANIFMRRDIAERIMSAFNSVYSWAKKEKISDAKVEHRVEILELDAWKVTKDQYDTAKEQYAEYKAMPWVKTGDAQADYKANTQHSAVLKRYENIIKRYEDDRDTRTAEVHIVRVGDVAFASNPFELFTSYQHRIQARSPFVQTFIVQLATPVDAAGYLCTERAADNMGYSANMFSCMVLPSGGDKLVEETLKLLNEMH